MKILICTNTVFLISALNFRSKFPSTAQDFSKCISNGIYLKPLKAQVHKLIFITKLIFMFFLCDDLSS